MAFKALTADLRKETGRRVLISGPPNSRKTSSLATWPHSAEQMLTILSFPGEKGFDSIDISDPGIRPLIWEMDDVTKVSPAAVIQEVERTTWEMLPKSHVFAGDGLHKLYGWYYLRARNELESSPIPDDVKDARAYGLAHDDFTLYLTRVNASKVPYAVFTVWDGKELDNPDAKKGPMHIFPDLPGKMAKRIMGEFSVVLYAAVGLPLAPGQPGRGTWQLQPEGAVWGAGCKIPARIAAKLPKIVDQNWATLEPLLRDGG